MKDDREVIGLMLYYCEAIQSDLSFVENDMENFLENNTIQRSCSFSLFQIGECSKRLSDRIKTRYGHIDWSGTARLRDVIGHRYEVIIVEELWNIIIDDVPVLREELKKILADYKKE